jgi:ribosome-associated protein
VATGDLPVPGGPVIPAGELRWRYSASGGPGGQHANTSNTRVELLFDPSVSKALDDDQRALVIGRLGSPIRVVSAGQRSQWRNRQVALERLGDRLADALEIPEERRATSVRRASLARRREARQHEQARRRDRRWTYRPDE